jgi:nicotinate-nucleotide--dimethylbenzimidazole phosphoribosyltransferase
VSDEAIALAFRTGLPFVGLRDHEHDPELDLVVPPDVARFARAIPLTAADDHVRLAVADPEPDLAALTPYLGDRRVELAIAPRDELEEVLGPPPPEPPEPLVEEEREREPLAAAEPKPLAAAEPEPLAADEAEPLAAAAEAEPLAADDLGPAADEAPGSEEAEAEPLAAAEPEPLAAEPPWAEPLAAAEAEPAPLAADDIEPAADEAPGSEEAEAEPLAAVAEPEPEPPAAEPVAAAEPEPSAPAAPDSLAPAFPATEEPSWLEPPRKRGWLRAIGRFLLYLIVLAVICGAVAAYLLTR